MAGLAGFAEASPAAILERPAKPWRRRDPAIYQSSKDSFLKMDRRVEPGDDEHVVRF
jgi:hypothetical protein